MSYRDEADALRAECGALDERLRERDAQLHELRRKIDKLEKRTPARELETTSEPERADEPEARTIDCEPGELYKLLFIAALSLGCVAGVTRIFAFGFVAMLLFLAAIIVLAWEKTRKLEVSREGIREIGESERAGPLDPRGADRFSWDQIDDAHVVQIETGLVKVRLLRQGRWQDFTGKWRIEPEEMSTLLTRWLSFERARRRTARVATQDDTEVERTDRDLDELASADERGAEHRRSRGKVG